jgi:hypothetical protein
MITIIIINHNNNNNNNTKDLQTKKTFKNLQPDRGKEIKRRELKKQQLLFIMAGTGRVIRYI